MTCACGGTRLRAPHGVFAAQSTEKTETRRELDHPGGGCPLLRSPPPEACRGLSTWWHSTVLAEVAECPASLQKSRLAVSSVLTEPCPLGPCSWSLPPLAAQAPGSGRP